MRLTEVTTLSTKLWIREFYWHTLQRLAGDGPQLRDELDLLALSDTLIYTGCHLRQVIEVRHAKEV